MLSPETRALLHAKREGRVGSGEGGLAMMLMSPGSLGFDVHHVRSAGIIHFGLSNVQSPRTGRSAQKNADNFQSLKGAQSREPPAKMTQFPSSS